MRNYEHLPKLLAQTVFHNTQMHSPLELHGTEYKTYSLIPLLFVSMVLITVVLMLLNVLVCLQCVCLSCLFSVNRFVYFCRE